MPRTGWGWLITPEELRAWIILEDAGLVVVNKPAHVVCHPSKHGPWSSLIGALREYLGQSEGLHMVTRLDRETSGVVVIAREGGTRGQLHRAAQAGGVVEKKYHAILHGHLAEERLVTERIGFGSEGARVAARRAVVAAPDGQEAATLFTPLLWNGAYTFARVTPRTGRTHQIRVHAAWMGNPIAGDKLYPDEQVFLDFLASGTSPGPLGRQALHATRWRCPLPGRVLDFHAPVPRKEWSALLPELAASGTIEDC